MDIWLAWWISAGLYSIIHKIYLNMYQTRIKKQAKEYLAKNNSPTNQDETDDSDKESKTYTNLNTKLNIIN